MKVDKLDGDIMVFTSGCKNPCRCGVSAVNFLGESPIVSMNVVWYSKGRYTNIQRKKMVSRTIISLIRMIVKRAKMDVNTHLKVKND